MARQAAAYSEEDWRKGWSMRMWDVAWSWGRSRRGNTGSRKADSEVGAAADTGFAVGAEADMRNDR